MAETTSPEPARKETRRLRPWYRRDPWISRLPRPLARLEREFENLMQRIAGAEEAGPGWLAFAPPANLVETDHDFEVAVELPGVKADEVHLELRNNELWIFGEKKGEPEAKGQTLHRVECSYGAFQRVIPLPGNVDEKGIEAVCRDGVLKICIPKSKEAQAKRIEVQA